MVASATPECSDIVTHKAQQRKVLATMHPSMNRADVRVSPSSTVPLSRTREDLGESAKHTAPGHKSHNPTHVMTSSHADSDVHTRDALGRAGDDRGPSPGDPRGAKGGEAALDPGIEAVDLAGVLGSRPRDPVPGPPSPAAPEDAEGPRPTMRTGRPRCTQESTDLALKCPRSDFMS